MTRRAARRPSEEEPEEQRDKEGVRQKGPGEMKKEKKRAGEEGIKSRCYTGRAQSTQDLQRITGFAPTHISR